MKISHFFILSVCVGVTNVYAGTPGLPPVLDNSTYTSPAADNNQVFPAPIETVAPATLPAYYNDSSNVDKLKNEVGELKNKIQAQENAINELKNANTEMQKKLADLSKPPVPIATFKSTPAANKATGSIPASVAATDSSEKQRYQTASELLKKSDYTQAISEFQSLIKTYPYGDYADNAQYWIGVALLNKGDKEGSKHAFDKLAHTYTKSEKIPDALYKLGSILVSENNKAKAKEYFDYVIATYPTTNAAALAKKSRAGL
jgi:tol-pal system protein YbgF